MLKNLKYVNDGIEGEVDDVVKLNPLGNKVLTLTQILSSLAKFSGKLSAPPNAVSLLVIPSWQD